VGYNSVADNMGLSLFV